MTSSFDDDERLDILQNIEFAIVPAADEFPASDDYDVMHALDLIIKDFRDIERGREPKSHSLDGAAQAIFQNVMAVCNWRLGKESLPDWIEAVNTGGMSDTGPASAPLLSHCLMKIRKSVDSWHGVGGSRGYLEFIRKFFP